MAKTEQRATRWRRAVRWSVVAGACVLGIGLIASWIVGGALVAPSPCRVGPAPSDLDVTTISFASDSGATISGWHSRAAQSEGVIVLLHGIRGSRRTMLARARMLDAAGYSTLMIDLQSHGESSGERITIGHLERYDARAAVEYARREHPGEPVAVIGVSMGGAAALLASPLPIDALVIESVYPNVNDAIHNRVAAKLGPLASAPSALLLLQLKHRLGISPSKLRPIDHLPEVQCPVFVMSGEKDLHTTAAETKAIYLAVHTAKELWLVEGAAHVDLQEASPKEYRERVLKFLEDHLRQHD